VDSGFGPEEHEPPGSSRLALGEVPFVEITVPEQPLPFHEEPLLPISNELLGFKHNASPSNKAFIVSCVIVPAN